MAVFKLSGVVLDGAGVSAVPTRQDLTFPTGEDIQFQLTVTGQGGAAFNITGYSGALVIKVAQSVASMPALATLALTLTSPTSGQGTFTLAGATTKGFSTGLLWYDVFITSGSGARDEVIPLSCMTLNFAPGA